ncbi:hypothetical protein [Methanobrevibacter sp.]
MVQIDVIRPVIHELYWNVHCRHEVFPPRLWNFSNTLTSKR